MLQINHLFKTFHPGTVQEVSALTDINLHLQKGSFTILIGANGSGKSTLLNLLAGTILPNSGEIMLLGKPIQNQPAYKRSHSIARIFQDPSTGTAPELSLLDNFRLASLRTRSKGFRIGINDAFRKVVASHISILNMGLENRLDQRMGSFSGGQRQALSLLMATFDTLDLLLLDEPTAALDPRSAELVLQLAKDIIREKNLTAVMVTHDLRHCLQAGDRIVQMDQGQILRNIGPEEKALLQFDDLLKWYSGVLT